KTIIVTKLRVLLARALRLIRVAWRLVSKVSSRELRQVHLLYRSREGLAFLFVSSGKPLHFVFRGASLFSQPHPMLGLRPHRLKWPWKSSLRYWREGRFPLF